MAFCWNTLKAASAEEAMQAETKTLDTNAKVQREDFILWELIKGKGNQERERTLTLCMNGKFGNSAQAL